MNPIFIYGFFAGLVYALHNVGFIAGTFAGSMRSFGIDPLAATAIAAIYLLAMLHFAGHGGLRQAAEETRMAASTIELVAVNPPQPFIESQADLAESPKRHDAQGDFRDLLSKRIQVIRNRYRLSTREAEVAELVARGNTVARIAEELVVSENTIRTHMRRLYAKLDIHKNRSCLICWKE